jgi:hypothetical protein
MNNKSSSSVLSSLKSIFNQLKQNIKSLESDEDPSFKSKEFLSYLSKKDIDYYIVTESQHQTLGIIDRFIQTLRDYCLKNQPLDHYKILTFVNKYNHSIHSSILTSPNEMQNNKNLEVEYIIDSINKQDSFEHSTGYILNINNKVRLIEKNKILLKKLDIMLDHFISLFQI